MKMVTLDEAARRLRISRSTLYRWSQQGRIKLYRLGPRATRIREEDLTKLETAAVQLHSTDRQDPWLEAQEHDLFRALRDVEREIPAGALAAYYRDVAERGIPIRWNPESEAFEALAI